MMQPEDYIGARRDALRSAYAGEIEALKRRGRQRRAVRLASAGLLAAALAVAAGAAQFGWRDISAGTAPMVVAAAGSRIHLDAGAAVRLPLAPWRREARLLEGDAVFDVVHDESAPFVVVVGRTRLTDLGTRFMVRTSDSVTRVAVFEGLVEVEPPSGPAGRLAAGEAAAVTAGGVASVPAPDEAEATAWRQGRLVFRDAPLSEVAERISRYRQRPVRVGHPAAAGLKVSGSFRLDDLDGALRTLEHALPVALRDEGEATLLMPRR
jgi:transmembrane sensor